MKWHSTSKEMPPRDTPVLLVWWNRDNKYNAEAMAIVKSNCDGTEWIEQTVTDWARELNMNPATLFNRLNSKKWSVEKALTTPVDTNKKRR